MGPGPGGRRVHTPLGSVDPSGMPRSWPPGSTSRECELEVRARLLPMAQEHVRVLDGLILLAEEEVKLLP